MNAPFAHVADGVRLADLHDPGEAARIERFVAGHQDGTVFHRPAWLMAVEQGTGQDAMGLVAERGGEITGWLPLTALHSPIFGRALVSSGFAVGGGVLADSDATALRLATIAEELALRRSCATVELRGGALPWHWSIRRDSHCGFTAPLAHDDDAQLLAIRASSGPKCARGCSRITQLPWARAKRIAQPITRSMPKACAISVRPFSLAPCSMPCWIGWMRTF